MKKDNKRDFGEDIEVVFLKNIDKKDEVIKRTTLKDLQSQTVTAAENDIVSWLWPEKGIKAGTNDSFKVKFRFIERNTSQNEFQGDKLQLKWTFEAQQGEGEVKIMTKKRLSKMIVFLLKVKYIKET